MSQKRQSITPYLFVSNGKDALEYYQSCIGAKIVDKMESDGKIIHASLDLPNGAQVMLCDDLENSSRVLGKGQMSPVSLSLTFTDLKSASFFWDTFKKCSNEHKILMDLEPQFWGDNFGQFADKFGHVWQVSCPLEQRQKVPQNPFETKATNKNGNDSKNGITGKKRMSMEEDEQDELQSDDTAAPPKKKQKLSSQSNNNNNNNSSSSSNGSKSDAQEKTGFKEIIKNIGVKYGLFREFTVGEKGESKNFSDAAKKGFDAVWAIVEQNKDVLKQNVVGMIAISPDDPAVVKPARYLPGALFDTNKVNLDQLKKFETDQVKVKKIEAPAWYIYSHCGSYDGLAASWRNAMNDIQARQLKVIEGDCCYENYLNDPSQTKESELKTLICIAVEL